MNLSGQQLQQLLQQINAFKHASISSDLTVEKRSGAIIDLSGPLVGPKGNVGSLTRRISLNFDQIQHTGLYVDADCQSQGFGRKFEEHCAAVYPQYGFTNVTVLAEDVGAYAWHDLGYELAGPIAKQRKDSYSIWDKSGRQELQNAISKHPKNAASFDSLETMFQNVKGGGNPIQPTEIAHLFETDTWKDPTGQTMWPGKLILVGSTWNGIKRI